MEKDILENKNIAIVGYGNMGKAIVQALLDKKIVKQSQLLISNSSNENINAILKSQIIILCVKPQIMCTILTNIMDVADITITDKLFISIAAGISIGTLEKYLGNKTKIIRVMPNLCARVGESMSCWVKNRRVMMGDVKIIKLLLQSFGKGIEMLHEDDLNKVTAISGSGPAYFFYFVEAFIKASIRLELDEITSKLLVMQTLKGALLTLSQSKESAQELRKQVTSKGGTTEVAINSFEKRKFKKIFDEAVQSAYHRSTELNFP